MDNELDLYSLPSGFANALAADPEALKAFLALGQEEQKSLIHQTKGVRTKAEMKALARTLHT
ncbi:MAG: YdeI/OmpD-associated family protein [Oscillospiraceae bacterium]|nr:YdeI/OmpD-associated family protein [Oscillospiraceae bacterium]MBR1845361.1 YdeI/OmpD-associated family protein [Oscillospiraceae bacterium]